MRRIRRSGPVSPAKPVGIVSPDLVSHGQVVDLAVLRHQFIEIRLRQLERLREIRQVGQDVLPPFPVGSRHLSNGSQIDPDRFGRPVRIPSPEEIARMGAAMDIARRMHFRQPDDIFLQKDDDEVDGKSIMGVLMLAAAKGCDVTVRAEGEDAEDALKAIGKLFAEGFGEGAA